MSRAQLLQLAKQGDTESISTLLNQSLFVKRVTLVEANLNENCLELKLVSPKVPNQYKLIPFLRDEISSLGIDENLENSVEETIASEENSPIIDIIEEVAETPIQSQQKSSRSLLPLALSFMIGLLIGLSIGYFLSPQKNSISEPTTYTIPQQ